MQLSEFKKNYMVIRKNQMETATNEPQSNTDNNAKNSDNDQIDALLAKALSLKPDLIWHKHWCRYCGARGSLYFLNSPWGPNKLCFEHHLLWKQNELNLSNTLTEPMSIDSVTNRSECTERAYLESIIKAHTAAAAKPYNLRKRDIRNNSNSDEDESSFNSSFYSNNNGSDFDDASSSEESESESYDSSSSDHGDSDGKQEDTVEVPKVWNCKDCDETFVSPSLFKKHSMNVHNNLSPFQCPKCDPPRSYSTNGNLTVHIKSFHEKIVNYRCKVCEKGFFDKRHCELHENSHYSDNDEYVPVPIVKKEVKRPKKEKKETKHQATKKLLQCKECDKSFQHNYRLKRHVLSAHTADKDKVCALHLCCPYCIDLFSCLKPHQCPCGYATARKFRLKEHQKVCQKFKNMDRDQRKAFNESTQAQRQRQRHTEKIHETPFQCELCDKSFAKQRYLNIHIGKIHKDKKDAVYKQQNVYKHLLTAAFDSKPWKCDECSSRFKLEKYLKVHKDRMHLAEEEKEFECNECHKKFSKKTYLNKHMRSHSKVKPYACKLCPYETAFKHRLKKHCMVHTGEKPFECDLCFKRFRRNHDVILHKKAVHR